MKHYLIQIIFLICANSIQLFAQTGNGVNEKESLRIDSIVGQLMKKYKIIGSSIAIVDNDKIAYSNGYGFADRRKKIAANENTIFGMGSVTKTFTAMAILKLNKEGKIDLNRSAKDYLPDLKITSLVENDTILRIRNLLTHTSGLPDDINNGEFCTDKRDFNTVIAEINKEVLTKPANWKMNYSNLGYILLGCIVERVTHEKYEDYIKRNILSKVSMNNSSFDLKYDDKSYSKGYWDDTTETREPELRDVPAGGLFSNVTDMSKFMIMILNSGKYNGDSIVSKSIVTNMETDHIHNVQLNVSDRFGYGLFIERMFNAEDSITGDALGHAGDTYVYHSTMFMFPKMNIGFVILSNSENGHSFCNTALIKLSAEYIEQVKGIKLHRATILVWAPKAMHNNITDYHEVTGSYGTGNDSYFKINYKNPNKLLFIQDNTKAVLKRCYDNTFSFSVRLLNIIPIRIKPIKFAFENIDGQVYLKQLSQGIKSAQYISEKEDAVQISDNWRKAVGKYKAINSCPGNMQGSPTDLKIVDGKIILMIKFPNVKETEGYSFRQLSDTLAAIDGIDRGCGANLKILPNGNLYFSGYELVKQ